MGAYLVVPQPASIHRIVGFPRLKFPGSRSLLLSAELRELPHNASPTQCSLLAMTGKKPLQLSFHDSSILERDKSLSMASNSDLRLRLRISRHGLPETRVMWTLDKHRSEAFSMADLLEEVSKIIPLEADDWGLDDYAVECDGFECLHFQAVRNILRDLDLVE